jgi:outer membrane protein
MKKIFLAAALAAAFVAEGQSNQSKDRVGYASMEYIVSNLPDMKAIETDLKSTQTQLNSQIEAKSKEIEKQYTDFSANMNTMADTVRENRQRVLEQAMADLEQMRMDAQKTLQNKQKLYMAPLYLQINRAIAIVAEENGYAIILTEKISGYQFLLSKQPQSDVSNLVLQKFGVSPPASK